MSQGDIIAKQLSGDRIAVLPHLPAQRLTAGYEATYSLTVSHEQGGHPR